jgi:hypothetical protein
MSLISAGSISLDSTFKRRVIPEDTLKLSLKTYHNPSSFINESFINEAY